MEDKAMRIFNIIEGVAIAVALGLIILIATSCASRTKIEYLTKENIVEMRDTIFREKVVERIDSVIVFREQSVVKKDSISPIVDSLNRLVGYDRWHFEKVFESSEAERKRYESAIDSLREVANNKEIIREPYPVEVEKEVNHLYWWQKILMWIGALGLLGIAIFTGTVLKHR